MKNSRRFERETVHCAGFYLFLGFDVGWDGKRFISNEFCFPLFSFIVRSIRCVIKA